MFLLCFSDSPNSNDPKVCTQNRRTSRHQGGIYAWSTNTHVKLQKHFLVSVKRFFGVCVCTKCFVMLVRFRKLKSRQLRKSLKFLKLKSKKRLYIYNKLNTYIYGTFYTTSNVFYYVCVYLCRVCIFCLCVCFRLKLGRCRRWCVMLRKLKPRKLSARPSKLNTSAILTLINIFCLVVCTFDCVCFWDCCRFPVVKICFSVWNHLVPNRPRNFASRRKQRTSSPGGRSNRAARAPALSNT